MNAAAKKPEVTFRHREHKVTKQPVGELMAKQMKNLGIKNTELAEAIGYSKPNVIAMMKAGSMRLPPARVKDAARVLNVDPVFLLGKVIAENDKQLWDVISSIMGDRLVSANELALIELVRGQLDGHDVNLAELDEFVQTLKPVLKAVAKREHQLHKAALERDDKGE